MAGIPWVGPAAVELNFTAPFGVVLRAVRKAAGWTQLRLAVELHRDHSYVSKWEKGVLRPDLEEVVQVGRVLGLAADECLLLRLAWVRSGEVDVGAGSGIERLSVSLRAAATLRHLGHPRVAYELAGRDSRAALEQARTARLSDSQLREVLTVSGQLLLEEVKAALDFVSRAQVRAGLLTGNLREHRLIREALGDRHARVRLAIAEEAVAYNADRLDEAHRDALALLDELGPDEGEWMAETIRAVAINSGMVGDPAALGRAWSRFREVEDALPGALHRFVLEGFARGFTPIAPDRAFEILEDATRALEHEPEPSEVRRVQLARAEGHLIARVSGAVGEGGTRRRLERALEISRRLELTKYVIELEALLVPELRASSG